MRTKVAFLTVSAACAIANHAGAAIVLSEDFETPDTTTISAQTLPASGDWVSNQSFNGIQKYIWDESYTYDIRGAATAPGPSTFSTPDGTQAYLFGYSSAVGITSKDNMIGSYTGTTTATLNFLMGKPDSTPTTGTGNATIFVYLYAVNPAGTNTRTSANFGGTSGTDFLLLKSASYGENSSALQAKQWNISLDAPDSLSTDVTGWDLSLRITGDNFIYPIIDNIQFDYVSPVPETSSALLAAIGFFALTVRRRK